jgi:hypothetical protein
MNAIFPIGLPQPTAVYVTLFLLTFVLHHAFMHYVLAGSLYLTWATIRQRQTTRLIDQPLAATLREWMPFLLSAAITAGVAPLLFIQIVYQYQFYTANLLLWWRWVVVVPVLIVAFYLLYLIKSRVLWNWSYPARVTVVLATSTSFVFVGFCWTINHLLANSEANWPEIYTTGRLPFSVVAVLLRMLVWIGGSFATMSVIAGWQLHYLQSSQSGSIADTGSRALAGMSISGIVIGILAGTAYLVVSDTASKSLVFGTFSLPYALIAISGAVLQLVGWSLNWRSNRLDVFGLSMATAGGGLTLLGVSVIREAIRISAVDFASLYPRHAEAAKVGGFGVFVAAAVAVTFLIAWCVRLVRMGIHEGKEDQPLKQSPTA